MYNLYAGLPTEGLETTDTNPGGTLVSKYSSSISALKSMVKEHTYVRKGKVMPMTRACDEAIGVLVQEGVLRVSDSEPTKYLWV